MSRLLPAMMLLHALPGPSYQWPYPFWSSDSSSSTANEQALVPRVLSFFPEPVAEECLSPDKRRRGICMNTYDCREQRGSLHGPCALGFGVCCVFTTSCGGEVRNNLTYVTSPGFPDLVDQAMNCSVLVKKIEPQVSQLRIDFLHFNIGQPNRRTGVCDNDVLVVRSGEKTFQLCGWNSGQHIYVDIGEEPVTINFRLPGNLTSRMWDLRVIQLGFEQRAPAGCLQYLQAANGTLKTLNYLPNGRYLADHDYLICIRQEYGMCSVAYSPCTDDSFRIGGPKQPPPPSNATAVGAAQDEDDGSGAGPEIDAAAAVTTTNSRCRDRVLIPCDFEEFITPGNDGAGICDLEHCGSSLCETRRRPTTASGNATASTSVGGGGCRVESSALPFHIRIAFGPGDEDSATSPEDNAGMCLSYEQLACVP